MVDGYEETDFGPGTSITADSAQKPVPVRDSGVNGELVAIGDQPTSDGGRKYNRHDHDIAVESLSSNGSHYGPELVSEAQSVSQVSIHYLRFNLLLSMGVSSTCIKQITGFTFPCSCHH
jgi:hypothetical protein